LLVAATALAVGAQGSVPPGYQTQSSTPLAPGVDHDVLTLADPPESVHVARVAPGAAQLVAVSSHDDVANQGTGGELPSEMCRRVGCLAGINGDFHDPASGEPVGGVVSGRRLLRSPAPGRAQLILTGDGRLHAGTLDWSGSVTASDGQSIAIGGVNVDPIPGAVVLYTPAWGGDTPGGADTELVVRATGAVGSIGATTPLEIVGVRSDAGPIPADGAVLAASGSAAATLHGFADRADAGAISHSLNLQITTGVDVVESLGGNPILLQDGHPAFPDTADSSTQDRHPRVLVGWNPAGEVVLVTVDGGRPDAAGMSLADAANLLSGLGATDGFGFDGSEATFVAGGDVQNLPVDDVDPAAPPPSGGREVAPGHMERPAVNTLMVVPNPAGPPPTPPTTTPGSGAGAGSGNGSGAGSGAGSGSGSASGSGGGGTTATTAPVKLSVAGGGSAPAGGAVAAPAPAAGHPVLPGNVDGILRNPTTKRPRRQPGAAGRVKTTNGGPEAGSEPVIPDWNDITAALTPDGAAASGDDQPAASVALGPAFVDQRSNPRDVGREVLELVAGGMILSVLWGLHRVRPGRRPRPAIWI
jgi:hypothetical protein